MSFSCNLNRILIDQQLLYLYPGTICNSIAGCTPDSVIGLFKASSHHGGLLCQMNWNTSNDSKNG